jgi:hypothetical protein
LWDFKKYFYLQPGNFKKSFIFGNPLLVDNRRNRNVLSHDFLSHILHNNNENYSLTVSNFIKNDGTVLEQNELIQLLGHDITRHDYHEFAVAITDSIYLANKNVIGSETISIGLDKFISRFRKGSRPFRRIVSSGRDSKIKCRNQTTTKTFFRLIGMEVPDESILKVMNNQWCYNLLSNKTREFVFKFRNNLLGLNTRVSHFNRDVNRQCTFCTIGLVNPVQAPDEGFLHLFFECPSTREVLERFCNTFLPELFLDTAEKKKLFFMGMNPLTNRLDNHFLEILSITAMFFLWDCKLQKKGHLIAAS